MPRPTDDTTDDTTDTSKQTGARSEVNPLPNARPDDVQNDVEGATRRGVMRSGLGALTIALGVGSAAACHDTDDEPSDRELAERNGRTAEWTGERDVPTTAYHYRHDLKMGMSGASLTAGDGGAVHTLHIARGGDGVDWFHDEVDMVQYDGPDGSEGSRAYEVNASYLEEGGTVVLLAAENDHGTILSPDAGKLRELLPDDVEDDGVRPHGADW